jgi:drug/metabolite transporter (DMT)-like permease
MRTGSTGNHNGEADGDTNGRTIEALAGARRSDRRRPAATRLIHDEKTQAKQPRPHQTISRENEPMSVNVLEYEQPAPAARWWQLVLAMIAMMAASSPQYVWALFVPPLQAKLGVTLSALQVTFALFSICQCGLGPMHGYLAEKFTPRQFAAMGGALVGASWVLSSYVLDLQLLYITYGVLSGIGTGMIYVAAVELMTRWFPERRGFAIGMVAGSYGFGAVITTFPIDASIRASGYQHTLLIYGLVLGIVSILVALGMRHPPIDLARQHRESLALVSLGRRNYTSAEMLRTPIFWLMFVMMSMMATGGLMVISQIGAFLRATSVSARIPWCSAWRRFRWRSPSTASQMELPGRSSAGYPTGSVARTP